MAGYFAAVVRAPVTGILLICEMTGTLSHMLSLAMVSLIAYATADLLRSKPIYDQLLHRMLRKRRPEAEKAASGDKVLVNAPVPPWARRPAANGSATYPGLQGASSFPSGGARRSWFLKGTPGCGRGTISPCCATNTTAKRYTARWRNSANPPSFPAALI